MSTATRKLSGAFKKCKNNAHSFFKHLSENLKSPLTFFQSCFGGVAGKVVIPVVAANAAEYMVKREVTEIFGKNIAARVISYVAGGHAAGVAYNTASSIAGPTGALITHTASSTLKAGYTTYNDEERAARNSQIDVNTYADKAPESHCTVQDGFVFVDMGQKPPQSQASRNESNTINDDIYSNPVATITI
jgi:hypothetical protein